MYKVTHEQLNRLVEQSYGNKPALEILNQIRGTKKHKRKKNVNNYLSKSEKARKALIERQTPQEKIFKAILKYCGVEYEFQKVFIPKSILCRSFYVVDFYIPSHNIAFEIDGSQHYTEKGIRKDKTREQFIKSEFGVIFHRIKNNETTDKTRCIEKVKNILGITE